MKKIIYAILLTLPLTASAAIVDYGTYFRDTDTGLYWLKLTETRNQSYDDVEAQLAFGQPLYGWRFAKLEELEGFINASGIPPVGNNCSYGNYCGNVFKQEILENLVRAFGDTHDAWLDETAAANDVSPTGTGRAVGYLGERGDVPGIFDLNSVYTAAIKDDELVDRVTQAPVSDSIDSIYIGKDNLPYASPAAGTFLVRTSDPANPIDPNDPNTLQLTLFDTLNPDDVGLGAYGYCGEDGPQGIFCAYDAHSWWNFCILDYAGICHYAQFALNKKSFDHNARPWFRMTGYDYKDDGDCDAGDTDLGGGWCRKSLAATEFSLVPGSLSSILPGTFIDRDGAYSVDNVELEFIHSNMQIDYDAWSSANTVRPKEAYFVTVGVKTLSIADGDPVDFDPAQIDTTTLGLGPERAPNVALPLAQDIDNDGDLDMVFGFRVEDSGISCLDDSVTLVAKTLSGDPLADQDSITPINCEETIDIDVDPFNPVNTIRPNDSYNVTVAILGMRTVDGDAVDVTPGSGGADDIDAATLRFGPAETGNNGTPIITDIDGDTRNDMLVTFNAYDAGIACGDTELAVTGEKVSGIPVEAVDDIVTEDCETGGCHP